MKLTLSKALSATLMLSVFMTLTGCHEKAAHHPHINPKLEADLFYVPESKLTSQSMDLFLPGTHEKAPVVVWIHGGAWQGGDKRPAPTADLIKKGIAVAAINYRLSQEAVYPAQIHDCKAAVRFLRANAAKYNLDASKIGVWGMSSGGHLAALMGTTNGLKDFEGEEGNLDQSSDVQAVCDWCGITDMMQVSPSTWQAKDSVYQRLFGGTLEKKKDEARQASPVVHVSEKTPPFLIMHGDKDKTVPLEQSTKFLDVLKTNQVPAQFILVEGKDHFFFEPKELAEVAEFFSAQFKLD